MENYSFFLNVLAGAAGSLRVREFTLRYLHPVIRFLSFGCHCPAGVENGLYTTCQLLSTEGQRRAQRLRIGSLGREAVISHRVCAGHEDG